MNGLGRNYSPSTWGDGAPSGSAGAGNALLLSWVLIRSPRDPRDLEDVASPRRSSARAGSKLAISTANAASQARISTAAGRSSLIERRNRLYQDLTRDFHAFDKDNFDSARCPPAASGTAGRACRIRAKASTACGSSSIGSHRRLTPCNWHSIRTANTSAACAAFCRTRSNSAPMHRCLRDRCQREGRLATLCGDYESFDRDWQAISYKLHQIPEMARTAELRARGSHGRSRSPVECDPQDSAAVRSARFAAAHVRADRSIADGWSKTSTLNSSIPNSAASWAATARRAESEAQMVCDTIDAGNDPGSVVRRIQRIPGLVVSARSAASAGRRQPRPRADRDANQPHES